MKKVLVAAMAVGLGLGVSATAMATDISSVSARGFMTGTLEGGGDGGVVSPHSNSMVFAAESWSFGNPYVIPNWEFGTNMVGAPTKIADEDKIGAVVVTAKLPEGIKIVNGQFEAWVALGQGTVTQPLQKAAAMPPEVLVLNTQESKVKEYLASWKTFCDKKLADSTDPIQMPQQYVGTVFKLSDSYGDPSGYVFEPNYAAAHTVNECKNPVAFMGVADPTADVFDTGNLKPGHTLADLRGNIDNVPSEEDWPTPTEGLYTFMLETTPENAMPGTPITVVRNDTTKTPEWVKIGSSDFSQNLTNDNTITFTIKEGAIKRELDALYATGSSLTNLSVDEYSVRIVGKDFTFNDPNRLLAKPTSLKANLTFEGKGEGAADPVSTDVTIARVLWGLGSSSIDDNDGVTVTAKSVLTEFLPVHYSGTRATTTKRALNALVRAASLNEDELEGATIMTQNGKIPFGEQELNVKITFGAKGGAQLPESVGNIWLDLDGNGEFDAAKDALFTPNEEGVMSTTINWARYTGTQIPLYVNVSDDVDGQEVFLPYYQDFEATLAVVDDNDVEYTSAGTAAAAGTWKFDGTVLAVPRFDIGGAGGKCTVSLVNRSPEDADYLTYFVGAENLKSGEVPEPTALGDDQKGTIKAGSSKNIPCNKIVKRVKGNQGALEVLVMERPGYITGATQTVKGSSVSVTPMIPKWNLDQ